MESRLDALYRSLLLTKFFTRGWGDPGTLKRIITFRKILGSKLQAQKVLEESQPEVRITKEALHEDVALIDGQFQSPLASHLPGVCPKEVETAHFQAVLPRAPPPRAPAPAPALRPLVLQFAGTGDHFYWRRRSLMARPMARERGVASILIENPFYGLRKPRAQLRSSLHHVSDLFVMGAALIMEGHVLLRWAEQQGYWPLACHGVSMGGHMASLVASAWPRPVALIPCLAWTSGSVTFCQGVMSGAIDWDLLSDQLRERCWQEEIWPMVDSPEFTQLRQFLSYPDFRAPPLERRNAARPGPGLDQTVTFMRGLMDECTHLGNYAAPADPELVELVVASYDAYQPRRGVRPLHEVLGCRPPREIQEGHIRAYLFHQHVFREAIYECLDRMVAKYSSERQRQGRQSL